MQNKVRPRPSRQGMNREKRIIFKIAFAFVVLITTKVSGQPQGTVPLNNWYSQGRQDNIQSALPFYKGYPGEGRAPDYRHSAVIGHIIEGGGPGSDRPQPGTVPLHRWYNPMRGDNFLTSSPEWRGSPGETRLGYRFAAMEGFVFQRQEPGTVPLYSWYHPERKDHFATTDWRPGSDRDGYRFRRTLGYIFPPQPRFWELPVGLGQRHTPTGGRRSIPLLTIYVRNSKVPSRPGDPPSRFPTWQNIRDRIYGHHSLVDYFARASFGSFRLTPARGEPRGHE